MAKLNPISIEALLVVDGIVADAEVHEPEPEFDELDAESVEGVEPEHTPEITEAGWAASGAEAEDESA
jgi:hypothetical protein